ncbi:hypothetical protein FISHEDRAFT_28612, partial [Fistulina hepatica ATCC 64428]
QTPSGATVSIARFAPLPRKHLSAIETSHDCPSFSATLKRYLNSLLQNPQRQHAAILSHPIPFDRVDVFTSFKLLLPRIGEEKSFIQEIVKAKPQRDKMPSQFDTMLVYQDLDAETVGL